MTTEFEQLVADFESLANASGDLSGADLKANRREQARIEKLLAAVVETGMTTYNDQYTDCRDLGHRWDEKYSSWEGGQLIRMCYCDRCGSEKVEVFSRTGYCVNRRYSYSEGYLLYNEELRAVGAGKKRYWRAVNIQRAISGS